jgi:hypothetical protein
MSEKDRASAMFTLDELARTIDQRAGTSAETSYTRSLIDKGAAHCARKFGEEAIEFAIAAAAPFAPRRPMFSTTCSSCSACGESRCRR